MTDVPVRIAYSRGRWNPPKVFASGQKFDSFAVTSECMAREDCIDKDVLRLVAGTVESSEEDYHMLLADAMKVADCQAGQGESCILKYLKEKKMVSKDRIDSIASSLKPHGPRNSNQWLSDSDINNICLLLEKDYPLYKHLGIVMSDMQIVRSESGAITPQLIASHAQKGKRMFSIVFNTDVITGHGQHWFCVFVEMASDSRCKSVEIFDSQRDQEVVKCTRKTNGVQSDTAGDCQQNHHTTKVYEFCRKVRDHFVDKVSGGDQGAEVTFVSDGTMQKGGSECGVYSIFYIYNRLKGRFDGKSVPNFEDQKMTDFRKHLFRQFQ